MNVCPRRLRAASVAALAVSLSSLGSAQLTPIGPFAGDQSEGFETQTSPITNFTCIQERVFNNTADLCTPGQTTGNITSGWGFQCSLQEKSGARFYGSAGGPARFTFDNPVSRFGGWFSSNSGTDGGTANFFDDLGNQIASEPMGFFGDCTWTWLGWSLPEGTTAREIEIVGAHSSGGFAHMDDLEVSYTIPDLVGTPSQISAAAGGVHTLALDAGAANGGNIYLVLGSVSGTAPGFTLDTFLVPLNIDFYTIISLNTPNVPPLGSTLGTLDPSGQAQATVTVPPNTLNLVGVTLNHAYVVLKLEPTLLSVTYVSSAVALALL